MSAIKPGDRVGYARKFLRNIGAPITDPMWFRSGVVTSVNEAGVAHVLWADGENWGARVLACNLARPGTVAFAD